MEAEDTAMVFEEIKNLVGEHNTEEMWGEGLNPVEIFDKIARAQAEISFKAGIKEVVELISGCEMHTDVCQEDGSLFVKTGDIVILKEYWQVKLKEWGVE